MPSSNYKEFQLRVTEEIIREQVSRCDICLVDLDQCVYPRFTQTTLGRSLLFRSLGPRYWRFLPRLLAGACYISRIRGAQLLGRHPTNYELMSTFSRVIRGIPLKLVEDLSLRLPEMGPQVWREALGLISREMSVYLLTFSIAPLARAYGMAGDRQGRPIFSGWRGTVLEDDGGMITGVAFSRYSLSPSAKLEMLEEIIGDGSFSHPLIIGHGKDEAALAVRSRELRGGSIGFLKTGGDLTDFELKLPGAAWRTIVGALE